MPQTQRSRCKSRQGGHGEIVYGGPHTLPILRIPHQSKQEHKTCGIGIYHTPPEQGDTLFSCKIANHLLG
jgi:hypothetical protein